jgi:putative ATP-binding cassette transporter
MGLASQIAALLSFVRRWTPGLRHSRLALAVVVATGLLSGFANALLIAVINRALNGGGTGARVAFVALCALLPLSRFASGAVLFRLSARAGYAMRMQLSRSILAAPLRQLETLGPHRLLATLTDDVPAITAALAWFPTFLLQVCLVLGLLLYIGWLSWAALALVVLFMAVGVFSYRLPVRVAGRYMEATRRGFDRLMKEFRGMMEGVKELKSHRARRNAFLDEELEPTAAQLRHDSVYGQMAFLGATAWGHVLFFLLIGCLLFVLPLPARAGAGALSGYALAILYMMGPLQGIMEALPTLSRAQAAMQAIERLGLALAADAPAAAPAAWPAWPALQLAGLTHTYVSPDDDHTFTLGPLDLAVERGETVFLTGGNGSGKTTLGKLIAGLYVPERGEIRLGPPVTAENREDYRQQFAIVFADCFVFDRLLGLAAPALDQRAAEHLTRLRLDHKVRIAGGALSTVALSQGQRKRLALLTAYLEDRPIYLFDEWAADQDPEFKEFFYRVLLPELRARGKTVIVISHDDRYYDAADRVVKLDSGQIVSDRRQRVAEPTGALAV